MDSVQDPLIVGNDSGGAGGGASRREKSTHAMLMCFLTALGGFFFGFDQGVSGGMFVMQNFVDDWCLEGLQELCSGPVEKQPVSWLNFQQNFVALLNLGEHCCSQQCCIALSHP